ncbi:MAG: hypothetical protein JXR20_08835 [Balneola sp.]
MKKIALIIQVAQDSVYKSNLENENLSSSFFEGLSIEVTGGIIAGLVLLVLTYYLKTNNPANKIEKTKSKKNKNKSKQNVEVNVNLGHSTADDKKSNIKNSTPLENKTSDSTPQTQHPDREMIIESMKSKIRILFIDDDTKFNIVQVLKSDGWKKTETVTDIEGLAIPKVKEVDIFFVDINGVGKLMNCQYQGLDLAQMLKEKYKDRMVVIYSAVKDQYAFHPAWDLCDKRLEKNALPNQFEKIVEDYSIEVYYRN